MSGLWHGANWTFVVWGGLNGLYLVIGRLTEPWRARVRARIGLAARPRLERAVQTVITFTAITCAWVFFRAASIADALMIFARALDWSVLDPVSVTPAQLALAVALILALLVVERAQSLDDIRDWVGMSPVWIRWSAYYLVIAAILALGVFDRSRFIYFQF